LEEHFALEKFLYREARLLDERKYDAWLQLLDDSIRYYLPNRSVRKPISRDDSWSIEDELSTEGELALLADNKFTLAVKIARLNTGLSFSENPASRTVRIVTNIDAETTDDPDVYRVYSNFQINRSRLERDEHNFVGSRVDFIKKQQNSYVILERKIVLNCTVLNSPNISIFL